MNSTLANHAMSVGADAPPHTGLLERVEFHARLLEQLIRYQNEMRDFFLRRIADLTHDVRGSVPTADFPPFEHWVEMQQKRAATLHADEPRESLRQAVDAPRPGRDYLGADPRRG